eukprot:6144120-Alexandrium_andersonii.AAC.1
MPGRVTCRCGLACIVAVFGSAFQARIDPSTAPCGGTLPARSTVPPPPNNSRELQCGCGLLRVCSA